MSQADSTTSPRSGRFQVRVLVVVGAALSALLLATAVAVLTIARNHEIERAESRLARGQAILEEVIAHRTRQLHDNVMLLASDFAFREAVATGEQGTIESVLTNHGSRLGADVAALVGLDGNVRAAPDTPWLAVGAQLPFPNLLSAGQRGDGASRLVIRAGEIYQLAKVPVAAPRPVAYLVMGFVLDESVLADVATLSGLDVTLQAGGDKLTTLAAPRRAQVDLAAWPESALGEARWHGAEDTMLSRVARFPTASGAATVRVGMHGHRDTILASALELRTSFLAIFAAALVLAVLVAWGLARQVTKPVRALAQAAHRIAQGVYDEPVTARCGDEFAVLAAAFNRMQTAIAERESQLAYQARTDMLTGLANRTIFDDRLSRALVRAQASGAPVVVAGMTLQRFRDVNATLGQDAGDEVLVTVAQRLAAGVGDADTVARIAGDEFAVLVEGRSASAVETLAACLAEAVSAPVTVRGQTVQPTARIGLAGYPEDGADAEVLRRRAKLAAEAAERAGAWYQRYRSGEDERLQRRVRLAHDLTEALADDQLTLHFQPKLALPAHQVVGVEALVRWPHPELGWISPGEFIPIAEETGQIAGLSRWVLAQAIAQAAAWSRAGRSLSVAVNLSAHDLSQPELAGTVRDLLHHHDVPADRLILEVTETAVMADPDAARQVLDGLRAIGIAVAIDDFGTGYSSLAQLRALPVDELKVDRAFLQQATGQDSNTTILRTTVALGHSLDQGVTAEGVEDPATLSWLAEIGCDRAQGFGIAAPMAASALTAWLDVRGTASSVTSA